MDTVTEIASAPLWASLAFIIILLITLLTLILRAGLTTIDRSDKRDLAIINDLRIEIVGLRERLDLLERLSKEAFERAIVAETDVKYLRNELLVVHSENAVLKLLLTRTQARVIQLVNVLIGEGIKVPDEASLEAQTISVANNTKPDGSEPLSSDIDKAVDTKPEDKTADAKPEDKAVDAKPEDKTAEKPVEEKQEGERI